jgi:hypothetical protein
MTDTQTTHSIFLPGLLLAIAVVGWAGFQTSQLVMERNNLKAALAEQDPQIETSKRVRERLESIAARTARVARAGNPNATIIVEQLRKRGVTINAEDGAPADTPAP